MHVKGSPSQQHIISSFLCNLTTLHGWDASPSKEKTKRKSWGGRGGEGGLYQDILTCEYVKH